MCVRCSSILRQCASLAAESNVIASASLAVGLREPATDVRASATHHDGPSQTPVSHEAVEFSGAQADPESRLTFHCFDPETSNQVPVKAEV